jgi:hypothetical protein
MKPQNLGLIEYLNQEDHFITREKALLGFGIQNLTAALADLRRLGYAFKKRQVGYCLPQGRKATLWTLQECFQPGDLIQVTRDLSAYFSLKGRYGKVEEVRLEEAEVTVSLKDLGFRRLPWKGLKRIGHLLPGTPVNLAASPLVVGEYHPEVNSYTLLSPDPALTLVASAALVRHVGEATCASL